MDLTNLQDETARKNTLSSDNPNCSQQLDSGNLNMQSNFCNANNFEKDMLKKNNDMFAL